MRISNRRRTIAEIKLDEIRENVLEQREKVTDVQEIAVYATEQNAEKDQRIADLQEIVVYLHEQLETLKMGGNE